MPINPGGIPWGPRPGFGGPLAFLGAVFIGGIIEHQREQHERAAQHPPRTQVGSVGTMQGQVYTPNPPQFNDVPPPPNYYPQPGWPQSGNYGQPSSSQDGSAYSAQSRQQYNTTRVTPPVAATPSPGDVARDAFDSVKEITKLDFHTQRSQEATGVAGGLRAQAGDLGKLFDESGQLNSVGQAILDPKGTGLFGYDRAHNEIYTTKPADQIGADAIADFQRKSWAVREAVDGNLGEAQKKLADIQAADTSPTSSTVKQALDVAKGDTHMDFELRKDGSLTAKMDGFFHHKAGNLNKLYDQDPQFMQALLGNGNITYDREHGEVVVRDPSQTSMQTIVDFQRNAEALGLAADGKIAEAHDKWNKIHGADQQTGAASQQVTTEQPAATVTQDGPKNLDDLNNAFKGTDLTFGLDSKSGLFTADAGHIKDLVAGKSEQDRNNILSGLFGKTFDDGKLSYDPQSNKLAVNPSNMPTADEVADLQQHAAGIKQAVDGPGTAAVTTEKPAPETQKYPTFQDYMHTSKQTIVAETQVMLAKFKEMGLVQHGINDVNHQGFDGLQGKDTDTSLKEMKKYLDNKSTPPAGGFNSEIDEATFRRLVQNFQKAEGIKNADGTPDVSGSVDQATLAKMMEEEGRFTNTFKDAQGKAMATPKFQLQEGMEVALNQPNGARTDMAANGRTSNTDGGITDANVADAIRAIGGKVVLQPAELPGSSNLALARNDGNTLNRDR